MELMSFKEWLKAWRGTFYWADARNLHSVNRLINGKKTEVMLILPLPHKWYGIGLVRCSKDDDFKGRNTIEAKMDAEIEND